MEVYSGHVLTLANSIIGVSILAMPYCFKQCGILLAIIILLLSNVISRLSCHFLMKSAIIARRKTFEYLAYYIFGGCGKFAIEIGMIGFLIGTCIAFFVVMGDLGPEIISEITGQAKTSTMRSTILFALAMFGVLPLGLLKNVNSLAGVSKATIGFYVCLVLKIIVDAFPHIFSGDWFSKVELWRPAGVIQCLPIFSMALSCQTQLFEIYQVVHNPSLEKMNHVIKNAVNICTIVYFSVGLFGYIAFADVNFGGNILMSFTPSFLTNIIKIGFILSIAFSFPLVIFPCRASVHSLIYKPGVPIHEGSADYIPEGRFKGLTLIIILVSLIIGILIPNIEYVLGLVGSSIGIMICVLFPVICFIYVSQKDTNERLLAKLILVVGMVLMILGTYENLHHLETMNSIPLEVNVVTENRELRLINPSLKNILKEDTRPSKIPKKLNKGQDEVLVKQPLNETKKDAFIKATDSPEIRHEPPQPIEPQDSHPEPDQSEKKSGGKDKSDTIIINNIVIETKEKIDKGKIGDQEVERSNIGQKNIQKDEEPNVKTIENDAVNQPEKKSKDNIDIEAIKKDEKETIENKEIDSHLEEHKLLIDKIQKQNEVQEELVKQQRKLIEVFEQQQVQKAKEEKLKAEIKAVKEIESIALQAIEKISGDVKENEKIVAEMEKKVLKKVNNKEISSEYESKNNPGEIVKLEELKLVNNLLSEKIKQNNITRKDNREIAVQDESDYKSLNAPKNAANIPHHNKTSNPSVPLLINLGQATNNESGRIPHKEMPPLPLVSYLQQQNNNLSNFGIKNNVSRTEDVHEVNVIVNSVTDENAKIMRRDILAHIASKRKR